MKLVAAVSVPARDGTELVTDVYLPNGEPPFPTIVIRTPYDRTGSRIQRKAGFYTSHGFAVVIQDVRGTGASVGAGAAAGGNRFYPWWHDGEDGADTLRWVEQQSFCDGNIGTLGGSYLASNQWLTAPQAPAALKCMVTCVGPYSFASGYYHGGAFYLMVTLPYALFMAGALDTSAGRQAVMGEIDRRFRTLPLVDADLVDGQHHPMFHDMLTRPFDASYWRRMDGLREPGKIAAPVLQMQGWFDAYTYQCFRAHEILRGAGDTEAVRRHSRILVGGWGHDREGEAFGAMDMGPNVAMDLYAYELGWFRHWLTGADTPIVGQPPVRVFTMGSNCWQDFASWPPPDATETRLYLHSRGSANTRDGDGVLATEPPADEPADHFAYDPLDPVPTVGGNHSADFIGYPAGPRDQSRVEQRADVLVYQSEPLQQPVEISGPVVLELYASTSAPDTDFTAKLVDAGTDGVALNLADGILRASRRHGLAAHALLEPGRRYRYEVPLYDTSHCFLPGHRIRLEVSSSNFPKYSRNLNTGADSHTTVATEVARQTVWHQGDARSALVVWLRGPGGVP